MKLTESHLISFVMCVFVGLMLIMVVFNINPYSISQWWNRQIKKECDFQDATPEGPSGLFDAWDAPNRTIKDLHYQIVSNHDIIKTEIMTALENYEGIPMNEFDPVQQKWLKNENRWKPLWIKFMGKFAESSNLIPTLKKITSMFDDITILHVSVFGPGTVLPRHFGVSRAVHRYHYGISIPVGDVGLEIDGHIIKWKEGEGIVWDDTLPHSAWNRTDSVRIIIFADIYRDLSTMKRFGSKLIYKIAESSNHVKTIQNKLDNEYSTRS